MSRSRFSALIALVLLGLMTFGAVSPQADAAASGPSIALDSVHVQTPGSIMVTGNGFTPGGRVYIAIYDPWGAHLYETRWVVAGPNYSARDGGVDPGGQGPFIQGGGLSEVFANLCGAPVLVRAYDQRTATWTSWLNVQTHC